MKSLVGFWSLALFFASVCLSSAQDAALIEAWCFIFVGVIRELSAGSIASPGRSPGVSILATPSIISLPSLPPTSYCA